jgi:hypothetical protein
MKFRKIKLFAIGVISVFFIVFAWYLINRFSYANEQIYYQVNEINQDTTLTVGIIGDSWVAGKKLDSLLHQELLKNGLNNKIVSSGHPGAKSKLIYQNLFENNEDEHSSKFIIEDKPDYCIVIAGVNDAGSQIGKKYYAFHMIQIINTLLHYEIKPIIVSLPEFDVEKTIDDMNILSKTRNIISAKINNAGKIDNISTYRNFLTSELSKNNLTDSIILIDFDKVCPDYSNCKDYYANPSHLSKLGNKKLCKIIANELKEKE